MAQTGLGLNFCGARGERLQLEELWQWCFEAAAAEISLGLQEKGEINSGVMRRWGQVPAKRKPEISSAICGAAEGGCFLVMYWLYSIIVAAEDGRNFLDLLKISEINERPLHLKASLHLQHKGCSNCWPCKISLCHSGHGDFHASSRKAMISNLSLGGTSVNCYYNQSHFMWSSNCSS